MASQNEPNRIGTAYKVFFLGKDGKLYPPVIPNENRLDTVVGKWLPCSCPEIACYTKNGRPKVKSGGLGTRGRSLGYLAFRPGWHLGELPYAQQFMKRTRIDGREVWPSELVWAVCQYSMDNDYQDEAMSYGLTNSGKFNHAYAGLPRIPENGYYRYRTNPRPDTVEWIITGLIKVERVLSNEEVGDILREHGIEPPIVLSEKEYMEKTKP